MQPKLFERKWQKTKLYYDLLRQWLTCRKCTTRWSVSIPSDTWYLIEEEIFIDGAKKGSELSILISMVESNPKMAHSTARPEATIYPTLLIIPEHAETASAHFTLKLVLVIILTSSLLPPQTLPINPFRSFLISVVSLRRLLYYIQLLPFRCE